MDGFQVGPPYKPSAIFSIASPYFECHSLPRSRPLVRSTPLAPLASAAPLSLVGTNVRDSFFASSWAFGFLAIRESPKQQNQSRQQYKQPQGGYRRQRETAVEPQQNSTAKTCRRPGRFGSPLEAVSMLSPRLSRSLVSVGRRSCRWAISTSYTSTFATKHAYASFSGKSFFHCLLARCPVSLSIFALYFRNRFHYFGASGGCKHCNRDSGVFSRAA